MNSRYCSDCFYRGKIGGMPCCDYLLRTEKKRPCPPGEGCTVKVTVKSYKRRKPKAC